VSPTSLQLLRSRIRYKICLKKLSFFSWGADTAIQKKFSQTAWSLFGQTPSGWGRVQAICDFVHNHISFGYEHAAPQEQPGKRSTSGAGSAAITHILLLPSADA
jgi:hypothetical protein